jgi:PAS domain S-box-containing protein
MEHHINVISYFNIISSLKAVHMVNTRALPTWLQYFLSILLVLLALFIREPLGFFGEKVPYLTFYPIITIIAFFFAARKGILALILTCVFIVKYILLIDHKLSIADIYSVVIFSIFSLLIIYFGHVLNKQREKELARIAQKVQDQEDLLALAHDYIIVCDMDSKITYMNPAALHKFGWTKEQIYGQNKHDLLKSEFPTSLELIQEELLKKGKWEGEVILTKSCGERVIVSSSNTLKYGQNYKPTAVLEISRDITKAKELEKDFMRLSQLDVVGEMAAGIGHEVRNPLTTVRGYLQLFGQEKEFVQYKEQVATMIEELDRANAIITEFLSLAKNKVINKQLSNLNDCIDQLMPLIQVDAILNGHTLEFNKKEIPNILLDKAEIRQLLLNITRNAFDAMKPGGIVSINTFMEDKSVILAIKDTGTGIPKEVLDQIGTPFITTKENGTGLGLSVCYRIAHRHNADIMVDTSRQGTTFFIKFNLV